MKNTCFSFNKETSKIIVIQSVTRCCTFIVSHAMWICAHRMLEKVKLVDKEQLEKERKEKGFALYVNGANTGSNKNLRRRNPSPSPRVTSKSRLISGIC